MHENTHVVVVCRKDGGTYNNTCPPFFVTLVLPPPIPSPAPKFGIPNSMILPVKTLMLGMSIWNNVWAVYGVVVDVESSCLVCSPWKSLNGREREGACPKDHDTYDKSTAQAPQHLVPSKHQP